MSRLILASKSPRRRELMEKLKTPFDTEPAVQDECIPEGLSVYGAAEYLSRCKAAEVYAHHEGEDCIVIGADTVVICDGIILGKPKDRADAKRMLCMLSGKTHIVSTGVTLLGKDIDESFTSETEVTFYDLSEEETDAYIASGEPMDKAGAYGIQGQGALFVKGIKGDYFTVVGFPIAEVYRRLNEKKA